jgi:hypothetical protein
LERHFGLAVCEVTSEFDVMYVSTEVHAYLFRLSVPMTKERVSHLSSATLQLLHCTNFFAKNGKCGTDRLYWNGGKSGIFAAFSFLTMKLSVKPSIQIDLNRIIHRVPISSPA